MADECDKIKLFKIMRPQLIQLSAVAFRWHIIYMIYSF